MSQYAENIYCEHKRLSRKLEQSKGKASKTKINYQFKIMQYSLMSTGLFGLANITKAYRRNLPHLR